MIGEPMDKMIRKALSEDIGPGDRTTEALIPPDQRGRARITAKEPLLLAGMDIAGRTFHAVDPSLAWTPLCSDGAAAAAGTILAEVEGATAHILTAERTALNFLQHLSGIATLTRRFVDAAGQPSVRILDTRKTTPGLRALEKYAVTVGGGVNHRMGLFDGILIKNNHITACGGIAAAIARLKSRLPHTLTLEVEVRSLEEVEEALEAGVPAILLDNMPPESLEAAVTLVRGKAFLEASGGVTLETVGRIARTGVQGISIGALTHSARSMDISLTLLP